MTKFRGLMSEDKPELMPLVWKLYGHALRLAEELEEPGLSEKERRWRYDALSKVASQLAKLLQMALEEDEVGEEDLVKILSGLSSRGMISRECLSGRFEKTRKFLRACMEYAMRSHNEVLMRRFEELLDELDRLEVKIKFVCESMEP